VCPSHERSKALTDAESPVPGAAEKIASLRSRHEQLQASIEHYESIVAKQTAELDQANQEYDDDDFSPDVAVKTAVPISGAEERYGPEDFEREEAEMEELERKKKSLEERVTGMDKDLGGLMR
jgi:chromosome segregation ATPase